MSLMKRAINRQINICTKSDSFAKSDVPKATEVIVGSVRIAIGQRRAERKRTMTGKIARRSADCLHTYTVGGRHASQSHLMSPDIIRYRRFLPSRFRPLAALSDRN